MSAITGKEGVDEDVEQAIGSQAGDGTVPGSIGCRKTAAQVDQIDSQAHQEDIAQEHSAHVHLVFRNDAGARWIGHDAHVKNGADDHKSHQASKKWK